MRTPMSREAGLTQVYCAKKDGEHVARRPSEMTPVRGSSADAAQGAGSVRPHISKERANGGFVRFSNPVTGRPSQNGPVGRYASVDSRHHQPGSALRIAAAAETRASSLS